MDAVTRDRAAAAIAIVAAILGMGSLVFGRFDPGIRLGRGDGLVTVSAVNEHSIARLDGFQAGMVVTELNGVTLVALPRWVYPTGFEDGVDPVTGEPVRPIGTNPVRPTVPPVDFDTITALLESPIRTLAAIPRWQLDTGECTNPDSCWQSVTVADDGVSGIVRAAPAVVIGLGILVVGAWWLATGRVGSSLASLALPLAAASAVPFLLRPLAATWSPPALVLAAILVPLALLPLGLGLASLVERAAERRIVRWVVLACAALAAAIGVAQASIPPWPNSSGGLIGLLVAAIAIVPGLAAAGLFPPTGGVADPGGGTGRVITSAELAVAGVTPLTAIATDSYPYVMPMALWLLVVAAAGRFTIRPLARLATRATLQRDLVVAATEAERARVAADIHDDALQELSLLVRRLDTAGDAEAAAMARHIADRLRAICGDLRLPILDDLGVGPALDWLVLRIERLAGGEVRLERDDGTRPPADVELAFFRVAQEALANAVKHGRPPIVVRYRTSDGGASLSIDDAGPGIAPDAGPAAERDGRFGLLNMQQRAEQIGAILDIRPWPAGGTHVALEWRPR